MVYKFDLLSDAQAQAAIIKSSYLSANVKNFANNKVIANPDGSSTWVPVVDMQDEGVYAMYNMYDGKNYIYQTLTDAKVALQKIQSQFLSQIAVIQQERISSDGTTLPSITVS